MKNEPTFAPLPWARRWFWTREARWTLAMFLCGAAISGFFHFVWPAPELRQGTGVHSGEFAPSLFLAAGRGFVNPRDFHAPEIAPFFRRETATFDPATLPEDFPVVAPHDWDQRHRYLYYAGALIWMIAGISWPAMKLLPVLLYASMTALLYRILRLAGGRWGAALLTLAFMLTPSLLDVHMTVRDFSKAPFFLAVVLIIGVVLSRRIRPAQLVALALLCGLVAGVGVGFRRDLVMAIPPALIAFAFAPRLAAAHPWRVKGLAALLLIAAFGVVGAPIHGAYPGLGDVHDAIMGFARPVDQGLGVTQADYYHLANQSDPNVNASQVSMAQRLRDDPTQAISRADIPSAGNHVVRYLAFTYPADVVTRAIASGIWAFSGGLSAERTPGVIRLLLGVALPALVLFIVASASPYRGAVLFLVCAPMFTYISLQFGYRHGFHLTFAPLWCALFLHRYARVLAWRGRLAPGARSAVTPPFLVWRGQKWGIAMLCGALLVLLLPLGAARLAQHRNVASLVDQYLQAPRTPVATTPRPIGGDWTLFAPDPGTLVADSPYRRVTWPFREAYLAAVFAPAPRDALGVVKYEAEIHPLDLSFTFRIPASPPDGGPLKLFFPVRENTQIERDWNRFAGVALASASADRFLGLYRLDDPAAFTFWSIYRIAEGGRGFKAAKRLGLPSFPASYRLPPPPPLPSWLFEMERVVGHQFGPAVDEAVQKVRAGLEADPEDAGLWLWLGDLLKHQEDHAGAEEAFRKVIALLPEHFVGFQRLEALAASSLTDEDAAALWGELARRLPDNPHALARRVDVLNRIGAHAEALEDAQRLIGVAIFPGEAVERFARTLEGAALRPESAVELWREITARHPGEADAWWRRANAEARLPDGREAAIAAFERAVALAPRNAHLRVGFGGLLESYGAPRAAIAQYEAALEVDPRVSVAHMGLARAHEALGDTVRARAHAAAARDAGIALPHAVEALLE